MLPISLPVCLSILGLLLFWSPMVLVMRMLKRALLEEGSGEVGGDLSGSGDVGDALSGLLEK